MPLNVNKVCKVKKKMAFGVELVVSPEKCPLIFKVLSPSPYSLMGNENYIALKYYVLSGCNLPAFGLTMK